MARKTLEQQLIAMILKHGLDQIESALRMYRVSTTPQIHKPKQKAKAATQVEGAGGTQ